MSDRLRVTQIKSTISHIARNRATIRALGLKRIGHTIEVPDNPATRGMVRQVRFLVSVEEVSDGAVPKAERPARSAGRAVAKPSKDGDAPVVAASEDSDSQEKA